MGRIIDPHLVLDYATAEWFIRGIGSADPRRQASNDPLFESTVGPHVHQSRSAEELVEDLFVTVVGLEMSRLAEVDEADVRKPLDEPRGR
jgi:hypothetical protein